MERNAEIKKLLKQKKERQAAEQREAAALAILEAEPPKPTEKLTGKELHTLLLFYGVAPKDQGKTVGDMRAKYSKLKEEKAKPFKYEKWTVANDQRLLSLQHDEIELADTAVGRYNQRKLEEAEKTLESMDPMERMDLLKKFIVEEAVEEEPREVTQNADV